MCTGSKTHLAVPKIHLCKLTLLASLQQDTTLYSNYRLDEPGCLNYLPIVQVEPRVASDVDCCRFILLRC